MHCNFYRVHQTLRVTPAMEAGIAPSNLDRGGACGPTGGPGAGVIGTDLNKRGPYCKRAKFQTDPLPDIGGHRRSAAGEGDAMI